MIVIIDYGMGNLHSVVNALNYLKVENKISKSISDIKHADGLILPGVGAFPQAMQNLEASNLCDTIINEVRNGKPILGICLGMQIMFEKGFEVEEVKGLGFFKGNVTLMEDNSVKIPHIGWNRLETNHEDNLVKGNPFVYFVHSFCASDYDDQDLKRYCHYGNLKVPAYFRKNNIMATQFHPEKSGKDGLEILKRFKEIVYDSNTSN